MIDRLRISRDSTNNATSSPPGSPNPDRHPPQEFSYREACDLNESITGKRISQQAWQIFPKILEIDDLVATDPATKVIEVHPEVSFAAWAGAPILEPKKKRAGFERRHTLVTSEFGPTAFQSVRDRYRRAAVANDDILDAFAGLWTAERVVNGASQTLPDSPPRDSRGLPMQIVY